jgi:signal transduction histidine kinase
VKSRQEIRDAIFVQNLGSVYLDADRLFFSLLIAQWVFAIALAVVISPYSWAGTVRTLHPHVKVAIVVGGLINALPLMLLRVRPGWWLTRHAVAAAQMLWSGLLIHLTGGRIETHFHIFGSLAFLAFYRDLRLFITATLVVAADHLARGLLWPESVYGIANPEWWRFLEHAAWVAFEDVVLALGCLRQLREMRIVADREGALEIVNSDIEGQVARRTAELSVANASLAQEMETRLLAEASLRQAQKLEAVGRLASGVAHEINTPVQYISDSVHFLRRGTQDLFDVIEKLQAVRRSVTEGAPSREAAVAAADAEEAADLPYLLVNLPEALEGAADGLSRVATIVRSMKDFSHPDSTEALAMDLNRAIKSTLVVAASEYQDVADIVTDFGELSPVTCYAGEINQAVLSIVVNAAHAVREAVQATSHRGTITIRTRQVDGEVVVAICDTGVGMPEDVLERVFDPFFTTKQVGHGTGQGLTIARSVVVERHGGQLTVESELGKGTTFFLRLPIAWREVQAA